MTDRDSILQQTVSYVKDTLAGEGTGHDWWHIYRVWKTALVIGQKENVDLFVVELGALLHDIADWKFHGGDETIGPQRARAWLESLAVDPETVGHVTEIVRTISFTGSGEKSRVTTREAMVVQDADRLDAMGAIGIARAFAYGGYRGREIYNPDINPAQHQTASEYKSNTAPSINHFYEKLLLLKDRMNTPSGKEMAVERHQFMEQFLDRFYKEWAGLA
jgi:uncharacterized protein